MILKKLYLPSSVAHKITHSLIWATIFAISMGYFEAAVVVDLREVLCVNGALFPLNLDSGAHGLIEIGREFFSLIMIISVAAILSRNTATGLAWFCVLFGVWDIFYYIFLKVLIGWPASLMTWDILFLIPVPWVSPVLAPVIAACTLIGMGVTTIILYAKDRPFKHPRMLFASEVFAALIMIISFCWQWREMMAGGIPNNFPWLLFALSELLMIVIFILFVKASPGNQQNAK